MGKQYGLVFDLRRCTGCQTCVVACKMENGLDGPSWMRVLANGRARDEAPAGTFPDLSLSWQPTACMHCQNPPCVEQCPEGAIYKRPDGIVLIDREKCTGCQLCVSACPYDAIRFSDTANVAGKCTLCSHRVDRGELPFCVRECCLGAIHFGDLGDPASDVSALVRSRKGYALLPERGTRPSSYYLPPF